MYIYTDLLKFTTITDDNSENKNSICLTSNRI